MATKHPRINITLEPEYSGILSAMAAKDGKSVSAVARELILQALEDQEDRYLSKLADERWEEGQKEGWFTHEEAWGIK